MKIINSATILIASALGKSIKTLENILKVPTGIYLPGETEPIPSKDGTQIQLPGEPGPIPFGRPLLDEPTDDGTQLYLPGEPGPIPFGRPLLDDPNQNDGTQLYLPGEDEPIPFGRPILNDPNSQIINKPGIFQENEHGLTFVPINIFERQPSDEELQRPIHIDEQKPEGPQLRPLLRPIHIDEQKPEGPQLRPDQHLFRPLPQRPILKPERPIHIDEQKPEGPQLRPFLRPGKPLFRPLLERPVDKQKSETPKFRSFLRPSNKMEFYRQGLGGHHHLGAYGKQKVEQIKQFKEEHKEEIGEIRDSFFSLLNEMTEELRPAKFD